MRLDAHLVARGGDRLRGARVEARRAADLGRTPVRAEALVVDEELRLLEFADQLRERRGGQRLRERVAAGREVALRLARHLEDRLGRKVEHQVEAFLAGPVRAFEVDRLDRTARLHARAVRLALVEVDLVGEVDRLLRARADARIAARADVEVDGVRLLPLDLECPQPARQGAHPPRPDREAAHVRQFAAARVRDEHAHFELVGEALRPLHGALGGADYEQVAARRVGHARHRLRIGQFGGGEQRRDLGRRVPAFRGPAGDLADVHELQVAFCADPFGDLREERRLLRARHDALAAARGGLERGHFLAAQLGVDLDRFAGPERRGQRARIERHGAVAIAELQRLVLERHRVGSFRPLRACGERRRVPVRRYLRWRAARSRSAGYREQPAHRARSR